MGFGRPRDRFDPLWRLYEYKQSKRSVGHAGQTSFAKVGNKESILSSVPHAVIAGNACVGQLPPIYVECELNITSMGITRQSQSSIQVRFLPGTTIPLEKVYLVYIKDLLFNVVPALVVRTEVVAEMSQGRSRGDVAVVRSRSEGPL